MLNALLDIEVSVEVVGLHTFAIVCYFRIILLFGGVDMK